MTDAAPGDEYYDIAALRDDLPFGKVDFAELVEHGTVSHSDSDALRDICGRVVRVFSEENPVRVRFLRLGNAYRTRAMSLSARRVEAMTYYSEYVGVLHGHVDLESKTCHPTRVVLVVSTVQGIPKARIKLVGLDDP